MSRELIAQAVAITTAGDPAPNPYRIASWIDNPGHGSFGLMAEIRSFLGGDSADIDPDILGPISSIMEPSAKNVGVES